MATKNGKNDMTKVSTIRQSAHNRVDKIMDKAEEINGRGVDEFAKLKEKAVMMRENIDGYIQKNPERSVLIAAGVGAVVGALLASALMRKR